MRLEELEPLTHRERMRRMVALGRDPEARAKIDALWRGGVYERTLALQSVYGSRDGARVVAAAGDPSRTIRYRALRLIVSVCDDASAALAMARLESKSARRRLLAMLQRRGRRAAVEAYLARTTEDVDMLPLATAALVLAELPRFREHAGPVGWMRLAKHQPAVAAAEALRAANEGLDREATSKVADSGQ